MNGKINIVCCLDDNFAQHCGVVMASVFENAKSDVCFHIVSDGLSNKNQQKLEDIARKYNSPLSIHKIDMEKLKNCYIHENSHVSIAAYFRILLPELLPDLDKVIYLDCDLVVRQDLTDMWNIDVSGYAIGAAIDGTSCDIRHYNRLMYDPSLNYINSGVMIVNLKYWREHNVSKKILEYIDKYPERLLYWDQDAINGTLIKETRIIPSTYNMQDQFFHSSPMLRKETLAEIENIIHDPAIVHFTTANKAWHKYSQHPFTYEYYKYIRLTPWKNYSPKFRKSISKLSRIKKFIIHTLLKKKSNFYRELNLHS